MDTNLLAPPIAFMILLGVSTGISFLSRRLAARGLESDSKTKSYACGEDMPENQGQPEYSQFFKFAFFFTIMHVVVLAVATDPAGISIMSALYLGVTVLSLFMLFRR
jgi:NADH-quinone oxidoreductase subunit A